MVECMSVVVNVMLSLMSVMSSPHALCNLSAHTVVKLCTLGVFCWGELGFLNCDDSCMCVMNKQFELPSLFLIPFMLTCSMMRCHFYCWVCVLVLYLWSCGLLWSVCEVVVVPYVDVVVAVMCVLLFVLHVSLLRECDGARLTAMLVWGMVWRVQGMWVVHVVQALCLAQLTCSG